MCLWFYCIREYAQAHIHLSNAIHSGWHSVDRADVASFGRKWSVGHVRMVAIRVFREEVLRQIFVYRHFLSLSQTENTHTNCYPNTKSVTLNVRSVYFCHLFASAFQYRCRRNETTIAKFDWIKYVCGAKQRNSQSINPIGFDLIGFTLSRIVIVDSFESENGHQSGALNRRHIHMNYDAVSKAMCVCRVLICVMAIGTPVATNYYNQ